MSRTELLAIVTAIVFNGKMGYTHSVSTDVDTAESIIGEVERRAARPGPEPEGRK